VPDTLINSPPPPLSLYMSQLFLGAIKPH
jgi:hypothetical protein